MRRRLIVLLGLALVLGVATLLLPVGRLARELALWVRDEGAWGVVAFAALHFALMLAMVPGIPMAVAAGFLFGGVAGALVASPTVVVASTTAFVIGRALLRPWAAERLSRSPRLLAIDEAVQKAGFRTIVLLRIAPIMPFNVLNYLLGATQLRTRDFAAGSFVGTLPMIFLYSHLGAGLSDVAELGRAGLRGPGIWIGLGVSVVAVGLAIWFVRRSLRVEVAGE